MMEVRSALAQVEQFLKLNGSGGDEGKIGSGEKSDVEEQEKWIPSTDTVQLNTHIIANMLAPYL
jgi:hypothetical protein